MLANDALSSAYADLLDGRYDCVDRIILNAYFSMGCSPGGFRTWWRALFGSDDNLDNTHLMRLAGRFSRRVRGWAKSNGVPVIDCPVGERKHQIAAEIKQFARGLGFDVVGIASAEPSRYQEYFREWFDNCRTGDGLSRSAV